MRARFGTPQLVFASARLAFVGMVMGLVFPNTLVTMTGFTLMGLGLANMMPVLFAAGAHVAGLAYFGLLFGPVLISDVAQISTLPIGLCVVAACCAIITVIGPRILKRWKI